MLPCESSALMVGMATVQYWSTRRDRWRTKDLVPHRWRPPLSPRVAASGDDLAATPVEEIRSRDCLLMQSSSRNSLAYCQHSVSFVNFVALLHGRTSSEFGSQLRTLGVKSDEFPKAFKVASENPRLGRCTADSTPKPGDVRVERPLTLPLSFQLSHRSTRMAALPFCHWSALALNARDQSRIPNTQGPSVTTSSGAASSGD
jgi:hypothetical protein